VAPIAALLYFLLHPTHLEILPVPSRRPETLCGLFMMLSLAAQLSPRSVRAARPPILPAFFTLIAVLSREAALILPALTFLAVLLDRPGESGRDRLRRATRALVPHLAVLVAVLSVRVAVLGGIGGHASTSLAAAIGRFPRWALRMIEVLVWPQPVMREVVAGRWMLGILVTGLVVTGLLATRLAFRQSREGAGEPGPVPPGSQPLRLGLLAVMWLVLVTLVYATAGEMETWYALIPAAGLAMGAGALAEWLISVVHHERGALRIAATGSILLLAASLIWQASYSPLIYHYREWDRATTASDSFLEELRDSIRRSANGTLVEGPPLPTWVKPRGEYPEVQGAAILAGYSVEAWAELTFPERRIQVLTKPRAGGPRIPPDELRVVLIRRLPGY
jgi:hypothetical protein